MKKTLLFLGLMAAVSVQAQQTFQPMQNSNSWKQEPTHHFKFDANKFKANKGGNAARSQTQFWLNYGTSIDSLNSTSSSVLHSNYLFPDSLCYGDFGGTNAGIWIHHVADVLDVKSTVFNIIDGVTWGVSDAYSVDSLSMIYAYTRNDIDPNVVDTLIVTMFTNTPTTNMGTYYFTGESANYGSDTVCFKALGYKQTTNTIGNTTLTSTGKRIIKIPLTIADTAGTFFSEKMMEIPGSYNVGAGKLLATDIQFKPGYSYALGDLIDSQHNAFYFTSYEELGAGTFPTYFGCNMGSAACDYNCSHILPQDVRYNTAGTWNGFYIPSYAYTAPFAYEHHLISYKVTNPPLAINEITNNNFALFQNQPNPFTNQTTIGYQLKKTASEVAVQIYDIRGVKMYEKTEKNVKPGNYSVNMNDVNFASGVYFCTLTVDGEKITNKMVKQ